MRFYTKRVILKTFNSTIKWILLIHILYSLKSDIFIFIPCLIYIFNAIISIIFYIDIFSTSFQDFLFNWFITFLFYISVLLIIISFPICNIEIPKINNFRLYIMNLLVAINSTVSYIKLTLSLAISLYITILIG